MISEVSTKKDKRKRTMKLVAALLGVFLLIGCCSIGGLMFLVGGEDVSVSTTPTPPFPMLATRQAIRATNEAAVPHTPTPAPTSTSIPTLTSTPRPTETPPPIVSSESQYLVKMYSLLTQYVEAMEVATGLNRQGAANPTLLLDDQWQTDVLLALTQVMAIGMDIRELESEAPPAYREAHSLITKSTIHYDAFASLYLMGVNSLDASLIELSSEELWLAADLMNQAQAAMP